MCSRQLALLFTAALMTVTCPVTAQKSTSTATKETTEISADNRQSENRASNSRPWERWGLTQNDWSRFQSIMAGPRGNWSPDISPISALGIHAMSEADRMRYAEIAAKQDWERLMSERAWYQTYSVAKSRHFTKQLKALAASQKSLEDMSAADHLVLFTDDQCSPQCRRALSVAREAGANLDIYFVGTTDREIIGQWAKANRISPDRVNKTKQVTLNIDNGIFQRIALDTSLPQLFWRDTDTNQLTEVQW